MMAPLLAPWGTLGEGEGEGRGTAARGAGWVEVRAQVGEGKGAARWGWGEGRGWGLGVGRVEAGVEGGWGRREGWVREARVRAAGWAVPGVGMAASGSRCAPHTGTSCYSCSCGRRGTQGCTGYLQTAHARPWVETAQVCASKIKCVDTMVYDNMVRLVRQQRCASCQASNSCLYDLRQADSCPAGCSLTDTNRR